MRSRHRRTLKVCAVLLLVLAPLAHAENWLLLFDDEDGYVAVDTDSIRQESDGLVHYRVDYDLGISTAAIDCRNNIYYLIGSRDDWRSKGSTITDEFTKKEAQTVCTAVGAY